MATKKAKEETKVGVRTFNTERIRLTLRGSTELVCNQMSEEQQQSMEGSQTKTAEKTRRGSKPPRDPKAEYQRARYLDEETGLDYFPGAGLQRCLIDSWDCGADLKKGDVQGYMHVLTDKLYLRRTDGKKYGDASGCIKPYMRRDRVRLSGIGRTTSLAYRPAYPEWEAEVEIEFCSERMTREQVALLINVAGFATGIGSWRPKCNGSKGMFKIAG